MKMISFGKSGLEVPAVALGCMRINGISLKEAETLIRTAMENGCSFFEHADIYGGDGACERFFAEAIHMTPSIREQMLLQSKCGIVPGKMYDFSKEHILSSVDGSLSRLKTDYLDVLVLHRPDALVEPEEVADAFDRLQESGKVRYFGVSNHKSSQIKLLQKYVKQPIVTNQLQLSVTHAPMIQSGMEVNMVTEGAADRDDSVLDFCRLNDITIQTWSPFQYGFFEGVFIDNDKFPKLNRVLQELADQYNVTKTTIAAAWILRHPAGMQLIAGTTKVSRLQEIMRAADITLSREEWYRLYLSAGHMLP